MTARRDTYGLRDAVGATIVDRVGCPTCGADRWWPCTPLRVTGHATCLRPHRERAALAAGGTPVQPRRWAGDGSWAAAVRAAAMSGR